MNKKAIKNFIEQRKGIKKLLMLTYYVFGRNRGLSCKYSAWLKKNRVYDKGKNNVIIINDGCVLSNCTFRFYGSNNKVLIDEQCHLRNMSIWIENDGNTVTIGRETAIHGKTGIACLEGTRVSIGERCMFSSNIRMRSGDSHSVLDAEQNRVNFSRDIEIGNHVWIGQDVYIGKGTVISENSIVGACAVVTRRFEETNVAIAGNPGKIIKRDIDWKSERI